MTHPPLWSHQGEAVSFVSDRTGALLDMKMGTGKSRVIVEWVNRNRPRHVLIVCPVSVLGVWRREFAKYADNADVLVLDKGAGKTVAAKQKAAFAFVNRASDRTRVVVINFESAWRPPFGEWSSKVVWDLVVADESHRVKAPSGKSSKWLGRMRFVAQKRVCLTGTPLPHSPLDIWAQARFIDPMVFGKSFIQFRQKYAVVNPVFPSKVEKWIEQDDLARKMAGFTFRCGDEMLDLPEAMHEIRTVQLLPSTMKIYDSLEKELAAEWDGGQITAANALVKLLRLSQITSGHVKPDDGAVVTLDTAKQEALADILEDLHTGEPVVVFCRFIHDLECVKIVCEKTGRRYGELSGRQKDLTPQATMPEEVDVLATQIESGGVGIDLTRAAYAVYFSIGYSLGSYEQSLARLRRPGQWRPVRYYHLIAEKTVDELVYKALEKRREIVDYVLGQLKGENHGVGSGRNDQSILAITTSALDRANGEETRYTSRIKAG